MNPALPDNPAALQQPFTPTDPSDMPPAKAGQSLPVVFSGIGSEYFRIWIVNVLLTLLTFTLYWPFARARRLAYLHNHTQVGGHALGFHADPWRMFRGHLVMVVLSGVYLGINHLAPQYTLYPLLVFALAWPVLWRASMRFRMGNTSWRGMRFSFEGSLKSAYWSLFPLFIPALVLGFFQLLLPNDAKDLQVGTWVNAFFFAIAIFMALMPWLFLRLKRYQHGGYQLAQEKTQLHLGTGRFYWNICQVFLWSIAIIILFMLIGGFFAMFFMLGSKFFPSFDLNGELKKIIFLVTFFVFYVFYLVVLTGYAKAKFQNLIWSNTGSANLQFNSSLAYIPYMRQVFSNWFFMVITLGFFWPFAEMRRLRMQLQAIQITVQGSVDEWIAAGPNPQGTGVLGDAAGDYWGIDIGV
jgi:uncharacterized membrane protein YjgN (DUF898 family)